MGGKKLQKKNHSKKRQYHSHRKIDDHNKTVARQLSDNVIQNDTKCHSDGLQILDYPTSTTVVNKTKQMSHSLDKTHRPHLHNEPAANTAPPLNIRNAQSSRRNKRKPRDSERTEVAVYDATFAQRQVVQHFETCVVCRKQGYFMKSCSRCQVAKCCSGQCLGDHCKKDDQRVLCVRNVLFTKARQYIAPEMKHSIFANGKTEISSHLYSIPSREVYLMMGGSRSVVLLQICQVNIDSVNFILQVIVQDSDGFMTALNIHTPPVFKNHLNFNEWSQAIGSKLQPGEFLLLMEGHWNNHANKLSAAVDIVNLVLQIRIVQHISEILASVTKKDIDAINRASSKIRT